MIWRESKNHTDDCYFCLIDTEGFNSKSKAHIKYPNDVSSVIRPVPHNEEIPIPIFTELPEIQCEPTYTELQGIPSSNEAIEYVPWLDIFRNDSTCAAKEITEWVEIAIDCYIPHRTFQLKPHSSPWFTSFCAAAIAHRNHYFHQYHRNATPENKKLFCDSRNHCKRVLKATRRSVASQLIGSRDFLRICNSVLNRGKYTIPPLFNSPGVLTTSTDKANLFASNFSYNSTLDDGSQQLPGFPSRTEQKLSSKNITAKMVSRAIYDLDTSKVTGPERIPAIVLKMCSPELSPFLDKLYNKCLAESYFPSCLKSSSVVSVFKNDGERSDPVSNVL